MSTCRNLMQNTPDPGSLVMDMVECAMKCDTTIGCNAASYYAEPISGNNCWLKTLGDPCELPADRQADAGATLLMKQDTCAPLSRDTLNQLPQCIFGEMYVSPGDCAACRLNLVLVYTCVLVHLYIWSFSWWMWLVGCHV